ncbi:hypothetical protein ACIQUL_29505 [Streptomyces sp. NPDC090303]|uniref:hypothetical protein n=1 Tax=Streptomyces sp. NPDC090303 TaxID=3365960 RepID=UPI003808B163
MKTSGMFLGLLPWILFSVIASQLGASAVGYAALAAFLGSSVLAVWGARTDGAKMIDVAGTLTFGALAVVGFTAGHDAQQLIVSYGRGGATLLLALLMLVSAFTVPFTEQYARAAIDRRYWHSPVFRAVNRRISLLWAGIVFATACCHLLEGALDRGNLLLNWVAPVVLVMVGLKQSRTLTSGRLSDESPRETTATGSGEHR